MLLHRSAEGVTECLDDASIVRSRSIVQSEGFSTVPGPGLNRRLYAVYSETVGKKIHSMMYFIYSYLYWLSHEEHEMRSEFTTSGLVFRLYVIIDKYKYPNVTFS